MKKSLLAAVFLCFWQLGVHATIRRVPGQYFTIQSALQASVNGDTILVAPGTYFENLRFKGKKVVLASQFLYSGDYKHIRTTIINGSQPAHPDTASVVRFTDAEDASTALIGFTLTGGRGTKWPDAHIQGTFREGGGILCEGSSPVIKHNLIINNEAVNISGGVASAGGGAIRCDGGQPQILNNVIMHNRGRYGGGIVLNFTGAIIRNNLICQNSGGDQFGGSGIWMLNNSTLPKIIENNTIIGNRSALAGGGVRIDGATVVLRNNLIWGNAAPNGAQIHVQGAASVNATYNLVEKGYPGAGNSGSKPLVADSGYFYLGGSPGIDAGDMLALYNDPALSGSAGAAAYPSLGSLRNDAGAYGGPDRSLFPVFSGPGLVTGPSIMLGTKYTGSSSTVYLQVKSVGAASLTIDSVKMKSGASFSVASLTSLLKPLQYDSVAVTWQPSSIGLALDTVLIYHNDSGQPSPAKVGVRGVARLGIGELQDGSRFWLRNAGPNPVRNYTTLQYALPVAGEVTLTLLNLLGQEIKVLQQSKQLPGTHQLVLKTDNLASGTYFARLTVSGNNTPTTRSLKLIVNR